MPDEKTSLRVFFNCLGISLVVSALKISLVGMSLVEIVRTLALTYLYNFISNIPAALAVMFGVDLYIYLKKNIKNEQQYYSKCYDLCR